MADLKVLQGQLGNEFEKFQTVQKDYQNLVQNRQQLEAQITENRNVKEELDLVDDSSSTVFKLIGSVLVKQELEEARDTVNKRIQYITAEISRTEASLKDAEKKQLDIKTSLMSLQKQIQQKQSG